MSASEKRHRWQITLNYTPLIRPVEASDSRKKQKLDWFTGFCLFLILVIFAINTQNTFCMKSWEQYNQDSVICFKLKVQICVFLVIFFVLWVHRGGCGLTWCPAPVLCQPLQPCNLSPRPPSSQPPHLSFTFSLCRSLCPCMDPCLSSPVWINNMDIFGSLLTSLTQYFWDSYQVFSEIRRHSQYHSVGHTSFVEVIMRMKTQREACSDVCALLLLYKCID